MAQPNLTDQRMLAWMQRRCEQECALVPAHEVAVRTVVKDPKAKVPEYVDIREPRRDQVRREWAEKIALHCAAAGIELPGSN